MAGTRVRPADGPSVNLPAIHVFDIPTMKDVDGCDIGEQSDAVLCTAMRGHDG